MKQLKDLIVNVNKHNNFYISSHEKYLNFDEAIKRFNNECE